MSGGVNAPAVSVIVPCYRQGHLLGRTIDSALGQTLDEVEVIVIDDGSDDETGTVAASFGDRIRYLRQSNQGLAAARNAGIAAARGRYLLFLDADDLLHASALEWLLGGIGGREDRLAVIGFRTFVDDPTTENGGDLLPVHGASWFADLFDRDPLLVEPPADLDRERLTALPYFFYTNFGPPHCFLSCRARVLEVGGFDTALSGCADWDLWLRLALRGASLTTIDRAGAFYRRAPGSMSTDNGAMLEDRTRLLLKCSHSLRGAGKAADPALIHLLQAARRVRRRYAAHRVGSRLHEALGAEITALRRRVGATEFGRRSRLGALVDSRLWDHLVLAAYRAFRRDLYEYYRSDID